VPLLLHLNGPSGVGKSTLARRWADERPGSLDLEADHLASLVGGWRDDFSCAFGTARHLALAVAADHLARGQDVVMPQLVALVDEARQFEAVAERAGATYVEVLLLVEPAEQTRRFREKSRGSDVDREIGRHLDARGGDDVLRRINGHLTAYAGQRLHAHRVVTDGLDAAATYALVTAAVDQA
jgi:AAA domain